MKIGIDLDSTVAKIDAPWLSRLNRACETNYRPEDWTDWELKFLSRKEKQVFFDVFTPDLYDEVEPYPGAPEVVRDLARLPGVELLCVTTNPSRNYEAFALSKRQWLRRHIPILADSTIFAKNKSGLGLDVLVDDAPHHFETPDFVPILVERPWNQAVCCELRFLEWSKGRQVIFSVVEKLKSSFEPVRQRHIASARRTAGRTSA